MPVSGRIISGCLGIHVNNVSLPEPDVNVVKVVINGRPINYFISLDGIRFTYPVVNTGDSITFVSVVHILEINDATVSLLIELEI